jgi:hypothetical protein
MKAALDSLGWERQIVEYGAAGYRVTLRLLKRK